MFTKLKKIPSSTTMITAFSGLNHNARVRENEFYDMLNLTSSQYPNIASRKKRKYKKIKISSDKTVKEVLGGISINGKLYAALKDEGDDIAVYDISGAPRYKEFSLNREMAGERTFVAIGSNVVVMPDKKYFNIMTGDSGNIEQIKKIDGAEIIYRLRDSYGLYFSQPDELGSNEIKSSAKALTPSDYNYDGETLPNGTYWIYTPTNDKPQLRKYNSKSSTWDTITDTYISLEIFGDEGYPFSDFNVGDAITITTSARPAGFKAEDLENLVIEQCRANSYIAFKGMLKNYEEKFPAKDSMGISSQIIISRTMPDMDFVIESGNRLWGCKYGEIEENGTKKYVNEIYASKLGDFKNWNCFAGISTDSYRVSLGSDGKFTGAITFRGKPTFFKEGFIHQMYGTQPSNFQIMNIEGRGVQNGCEKTLAIINENLFYKSTNGICVFDGSLPVDISYELGNDFTSYSTSEYNSAGVLGNKYYIRLVQKENGEACFCVYDTEKRMWHKESLSRINNNDRDSSFFFAHDHNLYIASDEFLISVGEISDSSFAEENSISWFAETGIIGTDSPNKKYITRIMVRMALEEKAEIKIFAQYDSSGVWESVYSLDSRNALTSYSVPIKTRRCDHLKLKIEGKGQAEIFSIAKTIEEGSDI